jgi:DNA-binding LacI/PurR family transcriptional regulator
MDRPIGAELAWLNCWRNPRKLRSFKEFDYYWLGAEQAAKTHGFRLVEFIVNNEVPFSRLENILQSRAIQGILIPPHGGGAETSPDSSSLNWSKFSVIRFGRSVPVEAHLVSTNYVQGPKLALKSIIQLGYERVGYIASYHLNANKASFLMSQTDLPQSRRLPILVRASNQTVDQFRDLLRRWVKKNKPDAILSDLAEMPVLLEDLGYHVPHDIALATTSVLDGKVDAGLFQNPKELGKVAVELLLGLLYHHEKGFPNLCREVLIDVSWQDENMLPSRSRLFQKLKKTGKAPNES